MQPAVLITGGSKRIGQAIALHLAKSGFQVLLHYRHSNSEAESCKQQIEQHGGFCELIHNDFNAPNDLVKMMASCLQICPGLNLLIHNASTFKQASFLETTDALFDENFNVHVKTPFILTREFAKNKGSGQVITILDTKITESKTNHFAYLLSKKALGSFTRMAAYELSPKIRVNAISPGSILAPENQDADYLDALIEQIPLKRKGSLSHILQAIDFLLQNDYVTGQNISVDGGEHL